TVAERFDDSDDLPVYAIKNGKHRPVVADSYVAGQFGVELHVWIRSRRHDVHGEYWIALARVHRDGLLDADCLNAFMGKWSWSAVVPVVGVQGLETWLAARHRPWDGGTDACLCSTGRRGPPGDATRLARRGSPTGAAS